MNRDPDAFSQIRSETEQLFPNQKIRLQNTDNAHKVLAAELVDGTVVEARAMSEGLLYYLAFSALRYIDGSRIFLIEEPENGLHPARIADVMRVLRDVSKTSQVIIATHSPLVINELTSDEVTVLTRDSAGTHAERIKDTPNFE
ncbi:MAG TPA: ATP-binding protein, partial [Polyangiaceae bacterium]